MSIPTGYERLAVIGIAWKDEYNPGTAYKTMNGVYYKGSTYVALRDNPTGPPAADGANWQYLAKGFEQQLLSAITALDTSGVLGQAGASVGGQALMDAIADKVMTKLVERSSIVQTESTDPTTVPSSPYFKKVTDKLTSDLATSQNAVLLYSGNIKANDEISIPTLHKYKLFHLGDTQNELYGCDVGGVVGNVLQFNLLGLVSGRAVFSAIKLHINRENTLKVIFNTQVNINTNNVIEYVGLDRESPIKLWGVPLI